MKEISMDAYRNITRYFRENPKKLDETLTYSKVLEHNRSIEKHYEVGEDIISGRWRIGDEALSELDFLKNYDSILEKDLSEDITKFILTLKN